MRSGYASLLQDALVTHPDPNQYSVHMSICTLCCTFLAKDDRPCALTPGWLTIHNDNTLLLQCAAPFLAPPF